MYVILQKYVFAALKYVCFSTFLLCNLKMKRSQILLTVLLVMFGSGSRDYCYVIFVAFYHYTSRQKKRRKEEKLEEKDVDVCQEDQMNVQQNPRMTLFKLNSYNISFTLLKFKFNFPQHFFPPFHFNEVCCFVFRECYNFYVLMLWQCTKLTKIKLILCIQHLICKSFHYF